MTSIINSGLLGRIIPLLPALASSNVLAISLEWICHLEPLATLRGPVAPHTLSEVFRRSYLRGAWTFLINLGLAIGSAWYNYYQLGMEAFSAASPGGSLTRSLYGWAAVFGVLHIAPFGLIIVRHVHKACDGKAQIKDEAEVKAAIQAWLAVNRWRIWVDVAAVVCAVGAVVVQDAES